jgi:(2Fe-2S) ferredoxin
MPDVAASADEVACARSGCTDVSSQLAEPMLGTAPLAHAWLLLVHPGPWPRSAPGGLLDAAIADELERRRTEDHIGMAAIRQGPDASAAMPDTCYLASTRPGRTWLRRLALAEVKDLLDLDLRAIADRVAPGFGEPVPGPLYAVCTHGKRDTCCAINGRPVHRALSRLAPGRGWEATHLGGHRFAANMLVLPEGLLYGRVDTANVRRIVDSHARGEIVPDLWRGRTTTPQPAQAAEWFARRATGRTGVDDVVIDRIDGSGDRWRVDLRAGNQPVTVGVEQIATGRPRLTACAGDAADPGRWRLVSLRTA